MLSDEWLPRYRLLENFTAKWNGNGNGNGNAYDRGDYNSSFALRAVELKIMWTRAFSIVIMITSLCNEDPLTPHFYIVKLGFTGVYIF